MTLTKEFIRSLARCDQTFDQAIDDCENHRINKLFQNTEATLFFANFEAEENVTHYPSCYFLDSTAPVFHCTCDSAIYPCHHVLGMLLSIEDGHDHYSGPAPLSAFCRFDQRPLEHMLKEVDHHRIDPLLEILMHVQNFIVSILRKGLLALKRDDIVTLRNLAGRIHPLGLRKLEQLLVGLCDALSGTAQNEEPRDRLVRDLLSSERCLDLIFQIQSCIEHNRDFLMLLYTDESLSGIRLSKFLNQPWVDWNKDLLHQCGLTLHDAELIQVGFLATGRNHDPALTTSPMGFWAAKNISDIFVTSDSLGTDRSASWSSEGMESHGEVVIPEFAFIIPGYMNHGICWEEFRSRFMLPEDLLAIRQRSHFHWEPVMEAVRQTWSEPTSDRHPVALLLFERLHVSNGSLYMESSHGENLILVDRVSTEIHSPVNLLRYLPFECRERQSLLVAFHFLNESGLIGARPMALVTEREVLRLVS